MPALRYVLVFAVPVVAAALLFYGTLPLRTEAHRLSTEFVGLALSIDGDAKSKGTTFLVDDNLPQVFRWIKLLTIGTILLAGGASALFVRVEYSGERKLNFLTTMVAGFCAANLVVGFGFMKWPEFGLWVTTSLAVALCVIWLRVALGGARERLA